jgi:pimeloyl-ACP methyl ester carboxylesterase
MLIALDGSAKTTDPKKYAAEYFNYYVAQSHRATKENNKIYVQGPGAISTGLNSNNIRKMADKATAFIRSNSGDSRIYLIGWSRGAAACIQVAHDLKRGSGNTKIDALFLFDAVDQDTSTNSDLNFIPDSVTNVYHAMAIKKSWFDRQLFPTCGKTAAAGVNLVKREFNASHGGIAGGSDGDAGSKEWMWSYLQAEGVI